MVNWYRAALRLQGKLAGPWDVIETPTLIVWGEEDAALGIERLDGTDEYVRDLTIHRLPGVSHWVQQEAPQKVNPILREWLATPRPSSLNGRDRRRRDAYGTDDAGSGRRPLLRRRAALA